MTIAQQSEKKRISVKKTEQIVELLKGGKDNRTIRELVGVSERTCSRIKSSLWNHGTPYPPSNPEQKVGRPRALTPTQEETLFLDTLRDEDSQCRTSKQFVALVKKQTGVEISIDTARRLKLKWVRVMRAEEGGDKLPGDVYKSLMQTHPDRPILAVSEPYGEDGSDGYATDPDENV